MCKIHVALDVVIAVNARLRETLLILFTFMPSELIYNESYYLMSLKNYSDLSGSTKTFSNMICAQFGSRIYTGRKLVFCFFTQEFAQNIHSFDFTIRCYLADFNFW